MRTAPATDPLQPGVGTIAVNDSFLIESAIYRILKKHFAGRAIYLNLIELLHEVRQWVTVVDVDTAL